MICYALLLTNFTHILQGYLTGTAAIIVYGIAQELYAYGLLIVVFCCVFLSWLWTDFTHDLQGYFTGNYNDVIMSIMTSQITSLRIVYSGADQRKHQSSMSLAFVRGIHQWPENPAWGTGFWRAVPSVFWHLKSQAPLYHIWLDPFVKSLLCVHCLLGIPGTHNVSCFPALLLAIKTGPSGADRTQVGPMLAPWTLLFGYTYLHTDTHYAQGGGGGGKEVKYTSWNAPLFMALTPENDGEIEICKSSFWLLSTRLRQLHC